MEKEDSPSLLGTSLSAKDMPAKKAVYSYGGQALPAAAGALCPSL